MKIVHAFLSVALFVFLSMGATPTAVAGDAVLGKPCLQTATAACGKCGDRRCTPQCGETAQTCPKDCGGGTSIQLACGKCGDGRCTPQCGETASSCPKDCGVTSSRVIASANP